MYSCDLLQRKVSGTLSTKAGNAVYWWVGNADAVTVCFRVGRQYRLPPTFHPASRLKRRLAATNGRPTYLLLGFFQKLQPKNNFQKASPSAIKSWMS
jgi:hypothetical protein